ncbi:C-type lectin domain family 2 member B-like isoform X2 [Chelonoidis abingdonii]|uniref:C-type lectin domain family 2 member B-like isoform X2 n=1 Tax=Chelonoidis abingdonii TaxID=106734 RepID=UPI0013F27C58|nr:C-type lectin domain family 2 member D-like isoform X3 [Chelonoidis abingdonii]XP_032643800.1 C-type lectin domain family 2 member D-like isoform X3 [Chelonoidis abingdonii]
MDSELSLNGRQGVLPNGKLQRAVGWKAPLTVGVVVLVLIVAVALILLHVKSPPESKLPHVSTPVRLNVRFPAPCCLDGWVGYRGKCYYFSEAEGTWDSSQSFCSSLNASLAGIDTEKDLTFIMRYKGVSEFWIGLKRESAQLWRWVNGEQFNNLFMVRGEGDCAYLSDGFATSSWCSTKRYWICSKPDGMQREDVMPGD